MQIFVSTYQFQTFPQQKQFKVLQPLNSSTDASSYLPTVVSLFFKPSPNFVVKRHSTVPYFITVTMHWLFINQMMVPCTSARLFLSARTSITFYQRKIEYVTLMG